MASAIGVYPRIAARPALRTVNLVWTERCYLALLALQLLLLINPANWPLRHIGLTKHIGLLLLLPLLAVHFAGQGVFADARGARAFGAAVRRTWPFLVLALIVIAGSLYAERVSKIHNNFLSMGLYMPVVTLSAALLAQSRHPQLLLRRVLLMWIPAALAMIALAAAKGRAYHEEIFLITPLAIYFAVRRDLGGKRWLLAVGMLVGAVLTRKNTAYLTVVLTVSYWLAVIWLPTRLELGRYAEGFSRVLKIMLGVLAFAVIGGIVLFLIVERSTYLPSGNVEYRTHMYGLAWDMFAASPLIGKLFSGSSSILFTLYHVETATQVLPVHSDLMDILAQGGLLGAGLWLLGYVRALLPAARGLLAVRRLSQPAAPYAHLLAVSALCAIVVIAFNPVLTSVPTVAFMLWTLLGFLIGLTMVESRTESRLGGKRGR